MWDETIPAEMTPWKKSMNRVLTGMALSAVTLNFLCLNYILPTIGTILLLLGFRSLRRVNPWFKSCFVVSILRAAGYLPSLVLNTTIVWGAVYASAFGTALTVLNVLLLFIQFICLWRAFIAVQQEAELPPHAGAAVALILWYVLMCLLALVQYIGPIIAISMFIGYIFILRKLYKLSGELDAAGQTIPPPPARVSDRCVVISLLSFLLVGCVCGYLFGGSYPMAWAARDPAEHSDLETLKAHLTDLGFPAAVLDDLSAEDIAACDGALQVVADVNNTRINPLNELHTTGVGVLVPGEWERWIIFHHFLWTRDPGFYGTEAIQLSPDYRPMAEAWYSMGNVTGRVLYDNGGETFVADYYSLGPQTYTSNTIFGGNQSNTDVFAAFSMPRNGRNQRGYVAYSVDETQDGGYIDSIFNYTHQCSWLQYPAMTAIESRMRDLWHEGVFTTAHDMFQFDPREFDPSA